MISQSIMLFLYLYMKIRHCIQCLKFTISYQLKVCSFCYRHSADCEFCTNPCGFYWVRPLAEPFEWVILHYIGVIMGAIASKITSLTIVYSMVYSGADQRKHQSSASLAFVRRVHRRPVNSPYKWPVTRKMFPFDDVIM